MSAIDVPSGVGHKVGHGGRPVTPQEAELMRRLREAGYSRLEVARITRRNEHTVSVHAPMLFPVSDKERQRIIDLRADGHSAAHVAELTGRSPETVLRIAPGRPGKFPVAPIREAFLHSPLTAADVARHLEWWDGRGSADTSRVKRTLGILPDCTSGYRGHRTVADAEIIGRIAEAINVMPWEVLPDDTE
jgi:hypothetical protein